MASRKKTTTTRALPTPPTGQSGQGQALGSDSYPRPQTGGYTLGLNQTTHNLRYPQPNSANDPDPAVNAPSAPVPGPEAYRPSLAGNELAPSVTNPMDTPDEPALPDYPS